MTREEREKVEKHFEEFHKASGITLPDEIIQAMKNAYMAGADYAIDMFAPRWISVEDDIGIEGVQPITLTDEILAKNFVVTDDAAYGKHYGYYNDFIEVDICEYTDGIWQVVVDEIEMGGLPTWKMYVENVHQLQQAFRLANIEKEIEL